MYRKSLVVALVLLYSASAIGVPMHFHYCQGELKHVSFLVKMECDEPGTVSTDHACCQTAKSHCATSQTLNSCCDDATQWLQDDLPAICAKSDLDLNGDLFITALSSDFPDPYAVSVSVVSDASTRLIPRPLYLMQCALIFYG